METLKPKLRFPEFKDYWSTKIFDDILDITRLAGYEYSKYWEENVEKEIIALRGYNIGKGKIEYINLGYISNKLSLQLKRSRLSIGDIVYPCVGTIGNAVVIEENDKFHIQQNIAKLTPKTELNSYFISQFLMSEWGMNEVNRFNATSSQPNVLVGSLRNYKINIPSFQEQTRIANFLSSVDEKLNLLKEKKALLEDYKKGIMQKIFNQEIRFKDDNDNDFEDWKIKTLGEVGSVLNGLTYSPDDISEDGVLVLRSSNIKDNRLKFEDNVYVNKNNFTAVVENDILICVRNGSRNLIGKNTLITKEIEGVAFGAFMSVYRSDFNNYLIHWFGSNDFFENVNLNLGATINSINGSDLKKFKIPFPCVEEQTKIANFLTAIDKKIELVSNQIQDTQEYKKGLLQQMFV